MYIVKIQTELFCRIHFLKKFFIFLWFADKGCEHLYVSFAKIKICFRHKGLKRVAMILLFGDGFALQRNRQL